MAGRWIGAAGVWAALVGAACEGSVHAPAEPTADPVVVTVATPTALPATTPIDPPTPAIAPEMIALDDGDASSSPLSLATFDDRRVAVVADADGRRLVVVDLVAGRPWWSVPLATAPAHVRVHDGDVFATLRDDAAVVRLQPRCLDDALPCQPTLVERARWETASEPIALGFADDGHTLLVTSGWGRTLQGFALDDAGRDVQIPLAREPRGFVVDGDDVFVTHAVGSRLSLVSLTARTVTRERMLHWRDDVGSGGWRLTNVPRLAVQGAAVALADDRVIAPMVLAYPGEPDTQSEGYGMSIEGLEPFFPHEPVLVAMNRNGDDAKLRLRGRVVDVDRARASEARARAPKHAPPCLLPRAIAFDRTRAQVLVACQDLGEVIAYAATDERLAAQRRRWIVGAGTEAIAIDEARAEAWAWSTFDHTLDRLALDTPEDDAPRRIVLSAAPETLAMRGRRLFHTPTAFDGRSCASCHIDGRDDGLVWQSPSGLVQTPVLAGRLGDTAPFGWHGDGEDLRAHIRHTFRRMRAPKPDDATIDALIAWITTMPSHHSTPVLGEAARRGREVFVSDAAGCDRCHDDGRGTDAARHEILRGRPIDTPSLRFVADTAPYMHDGRYATLRETLVHTDPTMGATGHLREREIADLIAYLRVL